MNWEHMAANGTQAQRILQDYSYEMQMALAFIFIAIEECE